MIFVFDLDGTICFKGQRISEEICQALDACIACGHEVIFASARPIRDMLPVIPHNYHACRMIGGNGAFTLQNEERQVIAFDPDTAVILLELIERYQLAYLIDSDWDYSYTGSTAHPIFHNLDPEQRAVNKPLSELDDISKVVIFDAPQELIEQLLVLPITVFQHHNENLIDISPHHIHKMQGLLRLGVHSEEFIAFGNDQNDKELFVHATYSVCVGDHDVSRYANQVIEQSEVAGTLTQLAYQYAEQT